MRLTGKGKFNVRLYVALSRKARLCCRVLKKLEEFHFCISIKIESCLKLATFFSIMLRPSFSLLNTGRKWN
jgi:hypothetical protein